MLSRPRALRLIASVVWLLGSPACGGDTANNPDGSMSAALTPLRTNTASVAPVSIRMNGSAIAAGSEQYLCQTFANPFGRDVDLVAFQSDGEHTHHFFLFSGEDFNTDSAALACNVNPPAIPFVFSAQTPHTVQNYPEGFGLHLKAGEGLMLQVHYINITNTPFVPSATVTAYAAQDGAVTTQVGIFSFTMGPGAIPTIPAHTPQASPFTIPPQQCPLNAAASADHVNMLWMLGHMHSHGVELSAHLTVDNSLIYDSTQWSDPRLDVQDPALTLSSGSQISWSCNYFNDLDYGIQFGETNNDVMCALFGAYYPADRDDSTQSCVRPN